MRPELKAAIILTVILLAIIDIGRAFAHDQYSDWTSPSGGSCCHDRDCRPTTAWHDDEGWHARGRSGHMLLIPSRAIIHRATDGRCHICENDDFVYCFNPCEPKI